MNGTQPDAYLGDDVTAADRQSRFGRATCLLVVGHPGELPGRVGVVAAGSAGSDAVAQHATDCRVDLGHAVDRRGDGLSDSHPRPFGRRPAVPTPAAEACCGADLVQQRVSLAAQPRDAPLVGPVLCLGEFGVEFDDACAIRGERLTVDNFAGAGVVDAPARVAGDPVGQVECSKWSPPTPHPRRCLTAPDGVTVTWSGTAFCKQQV